MCFNTTFSRKQETVNDPNSCIFTYSAPLITPHSWPKDTQARVLRSFRVY